VAGRRHEEVQQHVVAPRRRDEHVAARAEPVQQRLGDERGEHRGQRRVDRVAARTQDVRARPGGEVMACGDDPAHGPHPCRTPGRGRPRI
jgi:hypothetical protein